MCCPSLHVILPKSRDCWKGFRKSIPHCVDLDDENISVSVFYSNLEPLNFMYLCMHIR